MAKPPRERNPEASAPVMDLDLETQIIEAELAIMAREARIRVRGHQIKARAQRTLLRHAGSGAAIAAGAGLVAWLLRRRHPSAPPPPPPRPESTEREHFAREAGLSIASLLPLIWPYMPHKVRKTVTPGTASTVLAMVAPLLARLVRRRRTPA